MVIKDNRLFPYPVLADFNDDYENSNFYADYNVIKTVKNIEIDLNINLSNEELKDLLLKDFAKFVCHIECGKSKYREMFDVKLGENQIVIHSDRLNGEVYVALLMISTKDISNYTNLKFNKDYEGISFDIECGSILAVGSQFNFIVEKDTTDLEKLPSVIKVIKSPQNDKNMKYDASEDLIYIYLNDDDYLKYSHISQKDIYSSITISSIIFPTILSILFSMQNEETYEEYSLKKWFKAIKNNLKNKNIDFTYEYISNHDPFDIAQIIFEMPISSMLDVLKNMKVEED